MCVHSIIARSSILIGFKQKAAVLYGEATVEDVLDALPLEPDELQHMQVLFGHEELKVGQVLQEVKPPEV